MTEKINELLGKINNLVGDGRVVVQQTGDDLEIVIPEIIVPNRAQQAPITLTFEDIFYVEYMLKLMLAGVNDSEPNDPIIYTAIGFIAKIENAFSFNEQWDFYIAEEAAHLAAYYAYQDKSNPYGYLSNKLGRIASYLYGKALAATAS